MSILFIDPFVFVGGVMCFKMHGKIIIFLITSFYINRRPLPKKKIHIHILLFSHIFVQSVCSYM